jgi:thiol:disulfide interchange protein DsbG
VKRRAFLLGTVAATAAAATSAQPSAGKLDAALLYEQLSKEGRGFAMQPLAGPRQPVYVLFDPQCRYCMQLWHNALPLAQRVMFVWIPVGLLNERSEWQAAAIVAAADPRATMERHETAFTGGGLDVAQHKIDSADLDSIRANTRIFRRGGGTAVPVTVFKDRSGRPSAFAGVLAADDLRRLLGAD